MAKFLREKSPDFKFSLHDAKIIDIDYDYGENRLIFKTQSGFIDIERNEMIKGTVEGVCQGTWSFYEFTADEEKKKTGIAGFFTRETVSISTTLKEQDAWYCPECKKVLMWMDTDE